MSHPFLENSLHIRWSTLVPDAVETDMEVALARAEQQLNKVINLDRGRLSFASVVLGYEEALRGLSESWGLITHLHEVCSSQAIQEAKTKMLPKISEFFAKIPLNHDLWDLLLTYSNTDEAKSLVGIQRRALHELMASFRQDGADLPQQKKDRLAALEGELSAAANQFSNNVLASTNAWQLIVEDPQQLQGLPASAIDAARADAENNKVGTKDAPKYRFTLKAPSYQPLMEHLEDASIRRQAWEGRGTIGRGQHDNTELIWTILKLRHEKAELLGKENFADYILERRMAKNGNTALHFTDDLHAKVKTKFDREVIALQEYRADKARESVRLFEPWEIAYWSERRRRELYNFDTEELRPYFAVDQVLKGMFELAEKHFDVRITARQTFFQAPGQPHETPPAGAVEVWHPEVKFFDVRNSNNAHVGSFYADWHPRDSKRSGAWMDCLRMGHPGDKEEARRPHLGVICGNMSPPLNGSAALLTHDEVCTIFHEFGHLLHLLLSEVEVPSLGGTNVAWDFVELPSQLMENFCWERESLNLFAHHHETGAPIPDALFKKMISARNYMSVVFMMRQLSLGKLDLELHMHHATDKNADLDVLSRQIIGDYLFPTHTQSPSITHSFTHLFAGSVAYASAYYSYKWAEVLDADAFTRFQREGVLNPSVGRALRNCILSRGNSEDPAKLFRDFMGRDPDPNALLVRAGLS